MGVTITCTNEDDVSAEFTSRFSPFLLEDCDGIFEFSNNVTTKDNVNIDGSTYLGSTAKMRNIVLTLAEKTNAAEPRNFLYRLFKPKTPGTFLYKDDDEERKIDYYVENVSFSKVGTAQVATVSLICPDPFFYDISDVTVVMSGWKKLFTFPHCFKSEKEEFGRRVKEQLKEIDNNASSDNIGITATITAEGAVKNPSLYHLELGQFIKIGSDTYPATMEEGDQIIICTETNNKNVYLIHDGKRTAINEYLDEDSSFIQLQNGSNTLRYDAESGADKMDVSISFRHKFLGV